MFKGNKAYLVSIDYFNLLINKMLIIKFDTIRKTYNAIPLLSTKINIIWIIICIQIPDSNMSVIELIV